MFLNKITYMPWLGVPSKECGQQQRGIISTDVVFIPTASYLVVSHRVCLFPTCAAREGCLMVHQVEP